MNRKNRSALSAIGAVGAGLVLIRLTRGNATDTRTNVPGPGGPRWLQTVHFLARPTSFLERNQRKHGDTFAGHLAGLGRGRMIVVSDPATIEEVFKSDPYVLQAGRAAAGTITPIAGSNSLLVLDAPKHLEDRRLMSPPFHGERMRTYESVMVEETHRSMAGWPHGEPFELREKMADITLDVILRAVFGMERSAAYDELRAALLAMVQNDSAVSLGLMVPGLRRDIGPWRKWSAFERAVEHGNTLIFAEIARRRESDEISDRVDILSMLMEADREDGSKMSDQELRDELITLLLAGHETTSTGMAWTFELLFRHPEAMEKLRASIQDGESDYLEAVIYESLRLRTVIPFVARVVSQPTTIGGYDLEIGDTVVPAVHLVHRRADIYPDPESFRPERFLNTKPGTYEWIPFGGGMRRCIGASFATFEMKTLIREILTHTELAPASSRPERVRRRAFTLVPNHGTMTIQRDI
ncbi:MAG: cytochrome P450 [Solirubrobacterales bacterium]